MTLRTKLIPLTALVVALGTSAASVAAAAADSSKTPTPTLKPVPVSGRQVVVKCDSTATDDKAKDGKSPEQKKEPDWAAIAAKLGTDAQHLQDALMNTKIWLGQQTHPTETPEAFLQHVADLLHQPVATVKTVLYDAGVFREDTDKTAGKPGQDADKTKESDADKAKKAEADKAKGQEPDKTQGKTDKTGSTAPDKTPDKNSDTNPGKCVAKAPDKTAA
ncbi:MAG: hypothetical protein HOW97_04910 [Catenulispora sp.]|nr:hypothetical protein [Catenulispora sp.]